MKQATPFLVFLLACGQGPSGEPSETDPLVTVPPTEPPAPTAPGGDPFERITPEELRPEIDSAWFECDGIDWAVTLEVAGRAASARAVVVRNADDPLAWDLDLAPGELVEGALWQPFRGAASDLALPCNKAHVSTVVEAHDATGALVDCVAFGPDAAALIAGTLDNRVLAGVSRGDWSSCRVR